MRQRLGSIAALVGAWALVALPAAALVFASSSKATVVASHETVVTPTFDGYATLDLGPYLPNLRYPSGVPVGAHIELGKTNLATYNDLIRRYAVMAARPEGEIAKIRSALKDMAVDSAASGALIGLAGPTLWVMLGRRRRQELFRHVTVRRVGYVALATAVGTVAVVQPWSRRDPVLEPGTTWQPLAEALPEVPVPAQARPIEVESGLMTSGTKRIATSLFDTYRRSTSFYSDLIEAVPTIAEELREPEDGETVAILVSDRHDNIGMDKVSRAIADAAGATMLLDAGDDTSTGSPWEAFSLDSLDQAFADFEHRYSVAGNHDHGEFVSTYFAELGFTTFDDELVEGPEDITLLGSDDPRSSGLGTWRDETGLSFSEHARLVADQACEYDEEGNRIATLLVHDANSGRYALERGCVDLVVGGHVHAQLGPTEVVGANGKIGYSYTTGTTGGAAYAIAIGSKLRRNAQVTLVTYREGRPVGLQPVTIRTVGDFRVAPYLPLDPAPGDPEGTEEVGDAEEPGGPGEPSGLLDDVLEEEPDDDRPGVGTTNDPSEDESP
jgi:hypothetical protein